MSAFTPAQMAQLTLTSGASNDTEQIDLVFEQLEKGDALESVNEFLTELTADEKVYTTWRWGEKNKIADFQPNKGNPLNLGLILKSSCRGTRSCRIFLLLSSCYLVQCA